MNTKQLLQITSQEFIGFLENEGALKEYIKNFNVSLLPDYRRKTPEFYVFSAFNWRETEEGDVFWWEIDDKWREIVRNGNMKKDAHYQEICYLGAEDEVMHQGVGEGDANLPFKEEELTESEARKRTPIYSGVLQYFPDAIAAIARQSWQGNNKHNPGEPLHWAREKSTDHKDCIARHLMTPEAVDPETGETHLVAVAWRALAALQIQQEEMKK